MHSHGIHNDFERENLEEVTGCILSVDSKMIGRNLRPFCAHMTSYFFFFLAQALSAARRFCLASIKESLCLELGVH